MIISKMSSSQSAWPLVWAKIICSLLVGINLFSSRIKHEYKWSRQISKRWFDFTLLSITNLVNSVILNAARLRLEIEHILLSHTFAKHWYLAIDIRLLFSFWLCICTKALQMCVILARQCLVQSFFWNVFFKDDSRLFFFDDINVCEKRLFLISQFFGFIQKA